jgi:hypothetical protein
MMNKVKVFTIGFTKKTAEEFFTRLSRAGVKRVIDIRLNNDIIKGVVIIRGLTTGPPIWFTVIRHR